MMRSSIIKCAWALLPLLLAIVGITFFKQEPTILIYAGLERGDRFYQAGRHARALEVWLPLTRLAEQEVGGRRPIAEPKIRQAMGQMQNLIASIYFHGKGVTPNPEQAAHWYLEAARNGHLMAQNNYGLLRLVGRGVPQNVTDGLSWLLKAAEGGLQDAMFGYATYHHNGRFLAPQPQVAAHWFDRLERSGDRRGDYPLALLLLQGHGVAKDLPRAIRLLQRATAAGNPKARQQLIALEKAIRAHRGIQPAPSPTP